jgi:uncharacterized phage protein gp47/JayE
MALNTQTFTQIVQNSVAAIQAGTKSFQDLTIGSILRAVMESSAAVVLFLQGLIVQLLSITRASTSTAEDLDSWAADYGVARLAAAKATGIVTFSRFTATAQAVVPIAAQVQSFDGTQTFNVTLDTTNTAYNATLGGYVLGAATASISVPVQAVTAGAGGNVAIGALNVIIQAIPGVDTVTNAAAFINGANAETDAAFRTRFVAYIASISKATKGAIGYAITTLKPGVSYALVENSQYNGTAQMGYFYVVIDDGTGYPTSAFLSSAFNAIDSARPVTSTFGVFAPVVVTANVTMTITTGAGYTHSDLVTLVQTAITNYISVLTLGQTLAYTRLAQLAYDASPGVINVYAVTLNGATVDVTATSQQVVKAVSVLVT